MRNSTPNVFHNKTVSSMTESTVPCFPTLYEEWLLRYGQAKGCSLKLENNSNESIGLTIAARIGFAGALQCAEMNADNSSVAAVRALLDRTLLNMDHDAGSLDSWVLPKVKSMERIDSLVKGEHDFDADAFFELYPECARENWEEGESSDDQEYDEIIEDQLDQPVKKQHGVSEPPQQRNSMPQNHNDIIKVQKQIIPANPYALSNPCQTALSSVQSYPRPINPYHTALPQCPSQVGLQPGYGNKHKPVLQSKSPSWDEYRNQQNPFQTAKEFYESGGGENDQHHQHQDEHYDQQQHHSYPPQRQPTRQPPRQPPRLPDPEPVRPANIPDSLKRKFQPPVKRGNNDDKSGGAITYNAGARPPVSESNAEDEELPEELKGLDKELIAKIQNEIMESGETITFDDIAGLEDAKQTVQELVCWPMKRPDLFTGLRRGPNGLLLFGPPGTGKTLIGKAIAYESGATFFSISSSSLTSKWIGEGEKLVRTLFAVAAYREPAVVFIDEIDSLLTQRKADENEASRRIKTEFLVQLDGTGTSGQGRVLVIGATNRPHELDDAARRRFVKRLYIPLPARSDREILLRTLLIKNNNVLLDADFIKLSIESDGFSGADIKALCVDAAMGPLRELGPKALEIDPSDVPPIAYKHFRRALRGTKASVAPSDLAIYIEWNTTYGSKRANFDDESDGDD